PQQKEAEMQTESPTFLDGQTVLFQGDSITDGGRRRNNGGANSPQALGSTYPVLVTSELLGQHIDKEVKFYNRGISGNKVFQLAERWQEDCLDLQPDILTILIGVNDFWHMVNGDYDGTVEIYERDFMALIEQTKAALPNVKIIIAEPFAVLVASELLGQHIDKEVKFYNRGISGNKVFQLAERWQEDCLDLQPDILTILIGVNDFWHMVNGDYDGTVEIYERDFMALIEQTKAALPNVKIIIAEPFAVKGGSAMTERWDNEFPAYQAAAKRVAEAHKTGWIACQSLFDEALTRGSVQHWCPDGVHPSPAGHQLMTEAWIQALREA
ncbi:MAG: GDSL-type esterase/lipase family protein, partial [Bacteroidota bacterium]